MRLIEYYIQLFLNFAKAQTGQPVKITRRDISKKLECSERNVVHILNKMEETNWIETERGRGRGNTTAVYFLKTYQEMFQLFAAAAPKTEDIEKLIGVIERSDIDMEVREVVYSLILQLFWGNQNPKDRNNQDYDTLNIPYHRRIYGVNPIQAERQTERHIVSQIFNTLVTYSEEKNEILPSVAHDWKYSNEGRKLTFYLRKGVAFHNSKFLTSEDVRFTMQRLGNTPSSWIIKDIEKITCHGSYVIELTFSKPSFYWIWLASSPKCSIVPAGYSGMTAEEFSGQPIGTGPFKVKEFEPASILRLEAHQAYFQERSHLDEISIHILPSAEKYFNVQAIEEKPVFYHPFSPERESGSELQFVERRRLSVKYLVWNMTKEQLRLNTSLRRKAETAIGKKGLINTLGYPRYEPAAGFFKGSGSSVNERGAEENFDGEVFMGRPLLLVTYELTPNIEDLKWLQKEWEKQGIPVKIKSYPYPEFLKQVKHADLVLSEYVTEEAEENSFLNLLKNKVSPVYQLMDENNKSKVNEMLNEALQQEGREERLASLKKIDQFLQEEKIVVPLYWTYQTAVFKEDLQGVTLSTVGIAPFKDLFFRKV
ncbi:ABC transporter substrate-binding protein [Evansella sp. LMS18]|uniref:ABC transporter substrate-binding protein n=1 Tax=Evansella sp. LMS18 TaxID=2924033 RepID=UPI0020D03C23|nr:ABC transporter substrate-binding protein [Evansella sp. LMS18]UTR10390.1 ABC transporter substrate-binding protein [Evansella sp. LMS18]